MMTGLTLDGQSKGIIEHLVADVFLASNLMQVNSDHSFLRRTFIRTFFAFIEGYGVVMRDALLSLPEASSLAPEKQCILRDQKYEVERNGKPKPTEARYPFLNILAATLRFWAELKGKSDDDITNSIFGVDGWNKFQSTLNVRHRLTHPKLGQSMEVSDGEIAEAMTAFEWLLTILADLSDVKIDKQAMEKFVETQTK
jgi:hypothetical protein